MSGSRWQTAAALLATGLALASSTREPPDTLVWRSSQAEAMQTAVLADLLEEVRSGRVDPLFTGKPVCVGLWSTVRVFERDAERDPNPLSLARLKRVEPLVRPSSACSYSPEAGLIETATGLRAIRMAAAQPSGSTATSPESKLRGTLGLSTPRGSNTPFPSLKAGGVPIPPAIPGSHDGRVRGGRRAMAERGEARVQSGEA